MALSQDLGEPSELDTEQPPSRHLEKALEFVISYYDINLLSYNSAYQNLQYDQSHTPNAFVHP